MTRVRGPLSPIRPGEIIRESLGRNGRSSITDLFTEYRNTVSDYNQGVPESERRRPMAYLSFMRYIQVLRDIGAVELLGYEPMALPPTDPNPMVGVGYASDGESEVVTARRAVVGLSEPGISEEAWANPYGAYKAMLSEGYRPMRRRVAEMPEATKTPETVDIPERETETGGPIRRLSKTDRAKLERVQDWVRGISERIQEYYDERSERGETFSDWLGRWPEAADLLDELTAEPEND